MSLISYVHMVVVLLTAEMTLMSVLPTLRYVVIMELAKTHWEDIDVIANLDTNLIHQEKLAKTSTNVQILSIVVKVSAETLKEAFNVFVLQAWSLVKPPEVALILMNVLTMIMMKASVPMVNVSTPKVDTNVNVRKEHL